MYVIESRPGGYAILNDISARELRESRAKWEPEGYNFTPVSGQRAHRWVRSGALHSTDLWLDDTGRMRKAQVAPDD